MGGFTFWHWLVVLAVVVVLFGGKGKISGIMGDVAHGIRNFKEGLKDPNEPHAIVDKHETIEGKKPDEVKQA
jgi:sec-independent protein translocase protein TatA